MPIEPTPAARRSQREHHIVLYGATGFVGRLVAEHLATSAPPSTRIALAGRSRERLEELRADLGGVGADWPLVVADAGDAEAVRALARSTDVVATTVGPYAKYGHELVAACVEAGTHYADLTGEVPFVRAVADRHHAEAAAAGTRIVHACGFDSVPSDLGVLALAERAEADDAGSLGHTRLVVRSLKGGFSGGTIDSARTLVDEVKSDRRVARLLADPYALSPDRSAEPDPGDERDSVAVARDAALGVWTAPFVMGPFNTRIVRRSNALQDWRYGRAFRYTEVLSTGGGPLGAAAAAGVAGGLAAGLAGLALPPTRFVLDRVLPAPGEGPSEEARRRGRFRMDVRTETASGARYVAVVAAQGDPGYAATAVMFGESALALALDGDALPPCAGVLTPATGIGGALASRLRARGFQLEVHAEA
jgi:short subunit dehydrogenase-like uncharacterized protein